MTDATRGFTITREFDATPEDLWRAWTDPDEIAEWWHPAGMTTPRESVSVDLRVGGRYSYTMVDDTSAEEYPTGGIYRELEENERLAFTWGNPADDPDETPVVSVTFESLGELTRMSFDVRGVDGMRGDESFFDGWDSAIDELAAHLGQTNVIG